MTETLPHIAVCVCTFRRPQLLEGLLAELSRLATEGLFTYSVVIGDNDAECSAQEVVSAFRDAASMEVIYCVEPEQNIALARNRVLAHASGDFIACIDDDETPATDWLVQLYRACLKYGADGVLGPVKPRFRETPPQWVIRGGFNDRPSHETGFVIAWTQGRTGNLLFKKKILEGVEPVFLPEFGSGGEDRNFFKRMIERGHVFVWSEEAAVHEWVPPIRWKRSFMLRRALLRGRMALNNSRGCGDLAKSVLAIVVYALALPVFLVLGQHLFVKYLIKICDHAGKLLAFVGLNPIREKYVIE